VACAPVLVAGAMSNFQGTLPQATAYFVSATGSDGSPGTSPSAPWRTWTKVTAAASSGAFADGDSIRFQAGGVYSGAGGILTTLDLTFETYGSGPRARIEGSGTVAMFVFHGGSISTVRDLDITNNGAIATGAKIVQTSGVGTDVTISNSWLHRARGGVNCADGAHTLVIGCLIEDLYLDGTAGNGVGAVIETTDCLIRRCGLAAALDGNSTGDGCTTHQSAVNHVVRCIIIDCNKGITHVNTSGTSMIKDSIILMDDIGWATGTGGQSPPWLRWGINQTFGASMEIDNVIVGILGTQPLVCINNSSGLNQNIRHSTLVNANSHVSSAIIVVAGSNTSMRVRSCFFSGLSTSSIFWASDGAPGQIHRTAHNCYSPVLYPTNAGAQFLTGSVPISWDVWQTFSGEFDSIASPDLLPLAFGNGANADPVFPTRALSLMGF